MENSKLNVFSLQHTHILCVDSAYNRKANVSKTRIYATKCFLLRLKSLAHGCESVCASYPLATLCRITRSQQCVLCSIRALRLAGQPHRHSVQCTQSKILVIVRRWAKGLKHCESMGWAPSEPVPTPNRTQLATMARNLFASITFNCDHISVRQMLPLRVSQYWGIDGWLPHRLRIAVSDARISTRHLCSR